MKWNDFLTTLQQKKWLGSVIKDGDIADDWEDYLDDPTPQLIEFAESISGFCFLPFSELLLDDQSSEAEMKVPPIQTLVYNRYYLVFSFVEDDRTLFDTEMLFTGDELKPYEDGTSPPQNVRELVTSAPPGTKPIAIVKMVDVHMSVSSLIRKSVLAFVVYEYPENFDPTSYPALRIS